MLHFQPLTVSQTVKAHSTTASLVSKTKKEFGTSFVPNLFFAVKKPSAVMVALFIRDNLEEVIGDEEGEEKETNFNPDERG